MEMKVLLLVLAVGLLGYVARRIEKKWRIKNRNHKEAQEAQQTIQEQLNTLRSLLKYDENGYKKESYEYLKDFNARVQQCMDNVFGSSEHKTTHEQVIRLQEEFGKIADRMKNAHKEIEELVKEMDKKVSFIRDYLDQTNFYPHHFALDNNKLSGMIVEINERKNENPFIQLDNYRTFSETLYQQVLTFQTQHQEVVSLIQHIDTRKDTYSKKIYNQIMELKNELYITLHKGEMEKSKKLLLQLKKTAS